MGKKETVSQYRVSLDKFVGVLGKENEKMTINVEFQLGVQPVKSEVNSPATSSLSWRP